MNTFHNTSVNNQPTSLDAIYKVIYSEMVCMTEYKAKVEAIKASAKQSLKDALVANYKAAKAIVVTKKSIFTNNTMSFTMEQLMAVRLIGSVKAKAIMEFCKVFAVTSLDMLARVKGVGVAVLASLKAAL